MATLERPVKEGSVRTYQEKVGLGFPDILASEVDADLDTIYSAWNGGVGTANLIPGSVTSATLAEGAVGTRELADFGVTTGKLAVTATRRGLVAAAIPTGFTGATGIFIPLVTLPPISTGGGVVLILGTAGLHYEGSNLENQMVVALYRDGVVTSQSAFTRFAAVTAGAYKTPLPVQIAFIDTPPAASHIYSIQVYVLNAQGNVRGPSAVEGNPGYVTVLELA